MSDLRKNPIVVQTLDATGEIKDMELFASIRHFYEAHNEQLTYKDIHSLRSSLTRLYSRYNRLSIIKNYSKIMIVKADYFFPEELSTDAERAVMRSYGFWQERGIGQQERSI